jgi:hypothetical protein
MYARVITASILSLALATAAAAQTHPDLSGTWVPASDVNTAPPLPPPIPGGPPPPPPPPRTLSMTITQSPAQLTIDRRVDAAGQETASTATYVFDGTETTRQMGALQFRTKAAWNGDSLVLSSAVSAEGNAVGELTEIYRLIDGNLVVESTRKSPAGTFTGRTVHVRKR